MALRISLTKLDRVMYSAGAESKKAMASVAVVRAAGWTLCFTRFPIVNDFNEASKSTSSNADV
jgi:hypothetical protein